jgi:hypothetical protein
MCTCKYCPKVVEDGVNGTIYPPPPWMPADAPKEAICYECENRQEQEGENQHQAQQVDAAIRAGRSDLL